MTSSTVPRSDAVRPIELLGWTVFLALLTGVAEAVYLFVAFRFWHAWLPTTPQLVWLAPLANLVLLAPLAVFLYGLARWQPQWFKPYLAAGVLAFAAAVMLMLLLPSLHRIARVLIVAGLTVQAARLYRNHVGRARRIVATGIPLLTIVVLVWSAFVNGALLWSEHAGRSARPDARAGAPNVLLLILDTVRAQSLGVYGYPRNTTPELTRIAAAGTRFDWAFSVAPWTLPSHATMFTGRYPQEHRADWQRPLDATYPTLAEILRDDGYETAGFVSNITYGSRQAGLDRGFLHYEDYPAIQVLRSSALARRLYTDPAMRRLTGYYDNAIRKRAPRINRDFLEWLDTERQPDRPFFAFLNYFDAHEPYMPPEPFREMFGSDSARKHHFIRFAAPFGIGDRLWKNRLTPEELQAEVNAYDASIASIDHAIGRLFQELQRRGVLENTIVVVASDHGEHLGEGGNFGHTGTLLVQALHVPLIVHYPRAVPAGAVVTTPVTLRDVPATILGLAGVGAMLPGHSLSSFWEPGADSMASSSPIIARVNRGVRTRPNDGMSSIIEDGVQYIRRDNATELLFDLNTDPLAARDLAGTSAGTSVIERLGPALDGVLARLQTGVLAFERRAQ